MHNFEQKVHDFIIENNMFEKSAPIIVGLSGGADSICLATLLKIFGYDVIVTHVNHNLRGDEALRDENFVRNFAKENNMGFELLSADIEKIAKDKKISCEMAGRNVRYDFFEELSQKYHTEYIAVAHNMNDNAETILMNIIQGASVNGQKGIVPINKKIKRPLLCVTREEIENYLKEMSISYVNDSTNFKDIYTRNFVRNQLIPVIKEINPNIIETLTVNSKIALKENEYIEYITDDTYKKICKKTENGLIVDFTIENPHLSIKRRLIKKVLEEITEDKKRISSVNIENILNLKPEKSYQYAGLTIRNIYGKLWFVSNDENNDFTYVIEKSTDIFIKEINKTFRFELGEEFVKKSNIMNIDYDKICGKIIVRSRKTGDKFSPLGLSGTQSVKDYFINKKIPSFLRNKIPIITCNDEIIGIFPDRIDKKFAVTKNTKKILTIKEI